MFWVLKRTASMRRFFWVPTTYILFKKWISNYTSASSGLDMDNNNNIIQKLFWTEMEFPILQAITWIILVTPCENHPGQKWMTGWSTISSNSIEQMSCVKCVFVLYVPPIARHQATALNLNQQTGETGDRTIELFSVTFVMSEFSPKWGVAKWLLCFRCVATLQKCLTLRRYLWEHITCIFVTYAL